MKIILNSLYDSKIVLVSNLFFQMFCNKILVFLIIILNYHSQLSKLIVFWLLRVLDTSLNATLYWSNVSRKNISSNQLGDLLCNLNTWINKGMVYSVWFLIREDSFWSSPWNTKQIGNSVQFYVVQYTWCISNLELSKQTLYTTISSSFCIRRH